MESELEDQLENNEIVEVEKPPKLEPKKPELKKPEQKTEQKKEEPKPIPTNSDEKVIELFKKKGKDYKAGDEIGRIGRSELKAKGFKGTLQAMKHTVGKYQLTRKTGSFYYTISLLKK
jgi:hypothetical protein